MKMKVGRHGIKIIPESEKDEAYIESTLGLTVENQFIRLKRVAPFGLSTAIAYLETEACSIPGPARELEENGR